MADKKISALPAASTPLAGTEVLPIVQSGTTVKVSVANVTAGRTIAAENIGLAANLSAWVSGVRVLQSANGGAISFNTGVGETAVLSNAFYDGASWVYTTSAPAARFSVNGYNSTFAWELAGAGAAGSPFSFTQVMGIGATGNITANTGNLVIGTAGRGIDFSANTHAAGMTSELLNDYEEGEFTPFFTCDGSNPTVTYTAQSGRYTKIGRQVFVQIRLIINTVSGGSGNLRISGLPYAAAANSYANALSRAFVFNFTANLEVFSVPPGSDTVLVYISDFTNTQATSANLQNGAFCLISGSYTV